MHIMHDPAPVDSGRPDPDLRPAAPARNAEFRWDEFDPHHYWEHNYTTLRADDREILELVSAWFARTAGPHGLSGLDIGAGPNLYPSLAMLPYCTSLTLREYSAANVGWLRRTTVALPDQWRPFWQVVSPQDRHGDFAAAAAALAERAEVEQGSVFDLPAAAWDLATMFFVAESISPDPAEFAAAVRGFVRAVRPGGPFACAFMERSVGYSVGRVPFPATSVGEAEVRRALEPLAEQVAVHRVETRPAPLRPGYTGMLVATGLAR
ncbi:MAG TPA: SCO2525 family SAM-dependent methyltransferase [Actinocrinis sp.]|nr:SCO2525 family SAM-dependent methyltransferase [Actinocrinis sp.]